MITVPLRGFTTARRHDDNDVITFRSGQHQVILLSERWSLARRDHPRV
jgi:hypothetical protein